MALSLAKTNICGEKSPESKKVNEINSLRVYSCV